MKKQIIKIIREEFDPTPINWDGPDWHDNAEEVAHKLLEIFSKKLVSIGCLGQPYCGLNFHDQRCPIRLAKEFGSQP